jgi:hypothetical protein
MYAYRGGAMQEFIADSLVAIRMPRRKDYLGNTRRTRVNRDVEDEAAAGAAARERCSERTLRGTYLWADNGVDATTGQPFAGAGYEYYDGNGNIEGVSTANSDGAITSGPFEGTYEVNEDCTGRSTYPGTPEFKYDLFIHPEGDMFTWVQTDPPEGVVSAVEQRVSRRRDGD